MMVKHELWLGNALLWRVYSMDGTAPTPAFAIPEGAVWKHETVPVPPKPATPEPFDPMKTIYPSDFFTHPPDPVTDFIARRVAKREKPMGDIFHDALRRSVRVIARGAPVDPRAEPISRAMSQPGPHDTPMRVRLMPYRGGE